MATTKKKYYVVWNGRKTGIFATWAECQKQIDGFPGAKYKSFISRQLAEDAFRGDSREYIGKKIFESELSDFERNLLGKPITDSVSVDAAWNSSNGLMEYQGVETGTGKLLFKQGPFQDATNNIGEFLAIVHAAVFLRKINSTIPIYTDSKTALSWIKKKKANTQLAGTKNNENLFEVIARAEKWLNDNTIENQILKWETKAWGEIIADFGRK